jgi:hypothetical protein
VKAAIKKKEILSTPGYQHKISEELSAVFFGRIQ